ncbi:hypothetical protein KIN20_006834 [Parelaphostrongylus tenuis]|uniref:Uncharacterized protein n=1 Tax=Parelaphostrongylus tenuis TaxID=148309 RepID=A0AAD5ML14_PARTN|nr:hypothetical protein KIN20_006834 [Parelaphostrongylus tenuis]
MKSSPRSIWETIFAALNGVGVQKTNKFSHLIREKGCWKGKVSNLTDGDKFPDDSFVTSAGLQPTLEWERLGNNNNIRYVEKE